MNENTTWSPGARPLTSSPTSSTTPAPSWPSTSGSGSAMVPLIAERSEWHTPQAPSFTVTSPRFGGSTATDSTTTGALCARQSAAFALRGIARSIARIAAPTAEMTMLVRDRLFIGGVWVAPSGKQTMDVYNTGNGERLGRIPLGDEKDVDHAVSAARAAFEGWSGGAGGV